MTYNLKKLDLKYSSLIIAGIVLMIFGFVTCILRETFVLTVFEFISILLMIISVVELCILILQKSSIQYITFVVALVSLCIGVGIYFYPSVPVSLVVITFGLYGIFNGGIKFITYLLYRNDHIKGRGILLIDSLMFIILGLMIILSPISYSSHIFLFIGIYSICLGYTYIRDGLCAIVPISTKKRFKRKIRINLPIIFVAIIPYRALRYINQYFLDSEDDGKVYELEEKKIDDIPNVEVLIHVTKDGYGALGHVDLIIDNQVISYGNYDRDSFCLFESIGDGILFFANKDEYIQLCIEHSKKTLFSFGLKLDARQYDEVIKKIEEIKGRLYRWYAPIEKGVKIDDKYEDYPSLLVERAHAKLYKFNSSRFKTYFVMSTNCVLLVDSVLGKAGTDLLNINGMITPGTYYDYFNREFVKERSFVITKKVYK